MASKTSKTAAPVAAHQRIKPKRPVAPVLKGTLQGVVSSDKRDKTRTVVIAFKTMHPKYGKYVSKKTVVQVHDPENQARQGDTVEVGQCRPISKTKRWMLVRVVDRGQVIEPIADALAKK